METYEREFIVAKLLSGITFFTFEKKRYKIINPTPEQLLLAEEISRERAIDLSFKQLLSEEEAKEYLNDKKIWTYEDEQSLDEAEKSIEDLKVALYRNSMNERALTSIRGKLKGTRKAMEKAALRKYSMTPMTLEYHRKAVKDEFLAAVCTFDESNKRMYLEKDFGKADSTLMEKAYEARYNDIITQDQMREVARNEPWRSYWMVSKQNLFGNPSLNLFGPTTSEAVIIPSSHLNQFQRMMVGICKMYDNAAQHPDCPSDKILDDNDMFDGWMIYESRKRDKEKKKKSIDELHGNQKGDEIFVMSQDKKQAQEIFSVNDEGEADRLRRRLRQVKASDQEFLQEADLLDVKMKLNKELAEKMAGKG